MKKLTTINLQGEKFTVYSSNSNTRRTMSQWDYRDIFEAHSRPSKIKVDVWNDWNHVFNASCEEFNLWVSSRNDYNFTISGWCIIDGITYNVRITKAHNELYKIA